jgi:hypothetical protein
MSDTDPRIAGLVGNPITLNYAVTCTAFNLDDKPKILLVDYQEYQESNVERRLPGGKFQAQDLVSAIETFISGIDYRNQSLEYFCNDVLTLNKEFLASFEKAPDHSRQNLLFNNFTENLLKKLQKCALSEIEFIKILIQTHDNTVLRELGEESGVQKVGIIHISSSSLNYGVHYKLGFVSTEVQAPCSYKGSPDLKIKKSDWYDVDDNISEILYLKHRMNFQEGIRQAIEFNIHPNVGFLKKFLTASY